MKEGKENRKSAVFAKCVGSLAAAAALADGEPHRRQAFSASRFELVFGSMQSTSNSLGVTRPEFSKWWSLTVISFFVSGHMSLRGFPKKQYR